MPRARRGEAEDRFAVTARPRMIHALATTTFVPVLLAAAPPALPSLPSLPLAHASAPELSLTGGYTLALGEGGTGPTTEDARMLLGVARALSWSGRLDESVVAYRRLFDLDLLPAAARDSAAVELALVLGWSGKSREGLDLLDRHRLRGSAVHTARGDLFSWLDEFDKARTQYETALLIEPDNREAMDGIKRLDANPRYAARMAKGRLDANPRDRDRFIAWLESLITASDFYTAFEAADSVLGRELFDDPDGAIDALRREAEEGNRKWLAAEIVRRREAWEKAPDGTKRDSLEGEYATVLLWAGKERRAFDHFRALLDRDETNGNAREQIATLYRWTGHGDWARKESAGTGSAPAAGTIAGAEAAPAYRYTGDSEGFRATTTEFQVAGDFGAGGRGRIIAGRTDYRQNGAGERADRIAVTARLLLLRGFSIDAAGAVRSYNEAGSSAEWSAGASYLHHIRWKASTRFERSDFIDRALSVATVTADGPLGEEAWSAGFEWTPDLPLTARADGRLSRVDDGNRSRGGNLNVSFFPFRSTSVQLRYMGSYLSYDNESDAYWTPDRYVSHRGGIRFSRYASRYDIEAEALAGRDTAGAVTGFATEFSLAGSLRLPAGAKASSSFYHGRVIRADGDYWSTGWTLSIGVAR